MALPQTPPGGGRGRAYTHVPYVSTKKGGSWRAWIAGPCHWYSCHTSTRTKPCLHDMTGGYLLCPKCTALDIPQVIGYQPLYREVDGRPVHVIVYELQREVVDKLKFHQNVSVGRGVEATDTVYLTPLLTGGTRYVSALPERNRPVCLDATLLRMWNVPELTFWYNQTQGASVPIKEESDTPVSLPGTPEQTNKPGVARWVGIALGDRAQEAEVFQRNEEFVRAAKGGSANGNGKHKPK